MDLTNQEKPPMKRMYVNVYQRMTGEVSPGFYLHDSRKKALAARNYETYLCTCPIEIPDLEGK